MTLKWNWRSAGKHEPMARVVVNHYLTRDELIDLLCISSVPTGEELGPRRTMETIRNSLQSALAWEPVEDWWESRTDDPAERAAWAERLIERL